MNPPLYCTLCAAPLEVLKVDPPEGANLGCENGHKFFYSPAHLEKGDILVIGELSFQCANEGPYPELIGGRWVRASPTQHGHTHMGRVTNTTRILRG